MFVVEDADGNQLVVKVDKWKGSEFDPSAPATQYAAVEAYLMAEYGLDVTVTNHAVVAGSYDESGGVFLSDGTLIAEQDIEDFWFGSAWTDKKGGSFDDKKVDYDLDFKHLPDVASDSDSLDLLGSKEQLVLDIDNEVDAAMEPGLLPSGDADDLTSLIESDVDPMDLRINDDELFGEGVEDALPDKDQINLGTEDPSKPSIEESDVLESDDLLAGTDEVQVLLSEGGLDDQGNGMPSGTDDSIGLEESYRLDLDDGDTGEQFD